MRRSPITIAAGLLMAALAVASCSSSSSSRHAPAGRPASPTVTSPGPSPPSSDPVTKITRPVLMAEAEGIPDSVPQWHSDAEMYVVAWLQLINGMTKADGLPVHALKFAMLKPADVVDCGDHTGFINDEWGYSPEPLIWCPPLKGLLVAPQALGYRADLYQRGLLQSLLDAMVDGYVQGQSGNAGQDACLTGAILAGLVARHFAGRADWFAEVVNWAPDHSGDLKWGFKHRNCMR